MNNKVIFRLVAFGSLAIISIMGLQAFWLINSYKTSQQEFTEKSVYALNNVAREFEKIGSPLPESDIIRQASSNYFVVNVNDEINANSLRYFLLREFNKVGLSEDFEYGIYDCATKQMIYHDFLSLDAQDDNNIKEDDPLLIYDEYTYYFGVRFPNRSLNILNTMTTSIILSVILLVTILFFLFSIRIILRQRKLSQLQKDFINNMTHEFKTPISTSGIAAQVFMDSEVIQANPRLNQYAHILKQQLGRLNDQVERVLRIAQVGQKGMRLNKEETNLSEMLKEIVAQVITEIEGINGKINLELPATDFFIHADKVHLRNTIHGLLDNAIKYCKEEPHIKVGLKAENSQQFIYVADNGMGIPLEFQDKIFNKFYRIPTGDLHDTKGFGLGLYYIRNICKLHGWKLLLDSTVNKGSIFKIQLNA